MRRVIVCIILGAIVTVAGAVLILIPSPTASFGWFAYVPLSDAVFTPASALLAPVHQAGLLVGVIGALLLAFGVGWWFGQRTQATSN
ncbi:MAG: hypothetical protein ABI400_05820 [Lacisediminihabitans sp.]